jgi:hypothetical protein
MDMAPPRLAELFAKRLLIEVNPPLGINRPALTQTVVPVKHIVVVRSLKGSVLVQGSTSARCRVVCKYIVVNRMSVVHEHCTLGKSIGVDYTMVKLKVGVIEANGVGRVSRISIAPESCVAHFTRSSSVGDRKG